MKVRDKFLKAAVKLVGGVFALTLMLGVNAQAKDVTVNSAGELQQVLDEAKNLSETLNVTIPAGSDFTIERFLYVYPNTVINAEGATIRNTNPAFALIATPEVAPSNITINGGTWEAGANSFMDYTGASNVTVKGAVINGSGTYSVILRNCENVLLEGCVMSGSCILLEGGKGNAVKGGSLTGSKDTSIQIRADGTVVDGVTIANSANNAIRIDNAQGVQILRNVIQNANSIGIESVGGGNHTITGNYLSSSGYMGIRVAADQGSVISDNGLDGNAVREGSNGEGLVVDEGSNGTVVSGNTILHTRGRAGHVGNGIIVNRSANITVSSNTVSDSANHGIQVSYQSSKVAVSGNTVSASGNMGISVSRGAQADLKNNAVDGSGSRGITFDGKDYEGKPGTVSGSVEGCVVTGSKEQGIYIEHAIVSMSGNTIANSGAGGMAITGSSTVTADKNKVYQDTEDNTYSGIAVTGGSRLTMNDNIISNFKALGVLGGAGTVVDGSNNQVNIASGGFKDSNGAYRIASGMSSNTIFAYSVGRTSTSIETELSGYPTGVVINGERIEKTGDRHITVDYSDTDPAGVIVYTQDAKGNAICMQAPVNFSLKELKVPVPEDVNTEEIRAFVSRLYTVAMGRPAEEAGLNDWTNRLATGQESGAQVAWGFFFSDEFTNKGLSDEQYVDTLYRTMFDREADQGGKDGWLKDLHNGVSREYVYRGFAESVEFDNLCNRFHIKRGSVTLGQPRDQNPRLTEFVSRVYYITLNRSSLDEAGINDWCGRILGGANPSDVVWGIVFSDEFTNRNLSNEDFVKVMYRTYFDREADEAGFNDWMGQLNNGASREHVVNGFSGSVEFANLVNSFGL